MMENLRKKGGAKVLREEMVGERLKWVAIDSDNLSQTSDLYATYGIDEELISYALDRNERAHMEYDWQTETMLIIYNVLNRTKEDNHYETIPITFIVRGEQLITIFNEDNAYIVDLMRHYLQRRPDVSVYKFLFMGLFLVSETYFPYLEELDKSSSQLNRRLRQRTTKKDLLGLSDIETGMVYLVSATNQNAILLEQLKGQPFYKQLDNIEKEQLEDSLIEARQLSSMTQVHAQVLQQLSGTYNNILNNNLNDNMTTLTIVSIILAVFAVITGFFGMNVPLPWSSNQNAWLIIILICIILWLVITAFIRYMIHRKS